MSIWNPRPEHLRARVEWELVRDQLAGTPAMRGDSPTASTKHSTNFATAVGTSGPTPWLPRYESDTDESFSLRWMRAFLFGQFAGAVSRIASKPFSEMVTVEALPADLTYLERNFDRSGQSLHEFASMQFARKVAFGGAHMLASMPTRANVPDNRKTAEGLVPDVVKAELGMQPCIVAVHPMSVIGWEWRDLIAGGKELVELVIRDDDQVMRDPTTKEWVTVERLRRYVIEGGVCQLEVYQRDNDPKKREKGEGEVPIEKSSLGIPWIPLVPDSIMGPEDVDPLVPRSGLSELLWLGLQHFMETAEQGVALLAGRAEGLVERGCESTAKTKEPLRFLAGKAMRTVQSPQDYDLSYVGPSGVGITHGAASLAAIEERCQRLGAAPNTRTGGSVTATGTKVDADAVTCEAEKWVRDTERALARAMRMADAMLSPGGSTKIDERLPGLRVNISGRSVVDEDKSVQTIDTLLKLATELNLPRRVVFAAAIALKIIPEGEDAEELDAEAQAVDDESLEREMKVAEVVRAPRALLNAPPDDDDDDEDADVEAVASSRN